jgi:hypothetical protein
MQGENKVTRDEKRERKGSGRCKRGICKSNSVTPTQRLGPFFTLQPKRIQTRSQFSHAETSGWFAEEGVSVAGFGANNNGGRRLQLVQ